MRLSHHHNDDSSSSMGNKNGEEFSWKGWINSVIIVSQRYFCSYCFNFLPGGFVLRATTKPWKKVVNNFLFHLMGWLKSYREHATDSSCGPYPRGYSAVCLMGLSVPKQVNYKNQWYQTFFLDFFNLYGCEKWPLRPGDFPRLQIFYYRYFALQDASRGNSG